MIVLDGTSGITSPNETITGSLNTPNTFGFKNRIINGGMGIWQRGTTFTVGGSTFVYTADRWVVYSGNSSTTVSRSSSLPAGQGFPYSAQVQRTAANTGTNAVFFEQIIESNNMLDLAGQAVTISFWAKAGANFSSTSQGLYVNTGTVSDQGSSTSLGGWTGYTSIASYTFTPTTTWTKYTVSATLSSSALELSTLFYFNPTGTAGADDSMFITGVQLEKGSTATSFDYRPYGTELAMCQRYYYNSGSTRASQWQGYAVNSQGMFISVNYPVKPRTTPTIALTNSATTGGALSVVATGTDAFVWGGLGGTTGNNYIYTDYTLSAEL